MWYYNVHNHHIGDALMQINDRKPISWPHSNRTCKLMPGTLSFITLFLLTHCVLERTCTYGKLLAPSCKYIGNMSLMRAPTGLLSMRNENTVVSIRENVALLLQ